MLRNIWMWGHRLFPHNLSLLLAMAWQGHNSNIKTFLDYLLVSSNYCNGKERNLIFVALQNIT